MDKDKKRYCVNHMGGKCVLCGYHCCLRALHFHHINPHEKDFDVSQMAHWDEIEEELEKCVLLCANCHMEVHEGMVDHEVLADLRER
jgi:5-methylcytosine-specific restriction endonuclease McrA